jgi:hypothetical protein
LTSRSETEEPVPRAFAQEPVRAMPDALRRPALWSAHLLVVFGKGLELPCFGSSLTLAIAGAVVAATVLAQQPPPPATAANPAPGCTSTPAQLEANKKVAMQFFRVTGDERVALAEPSYKQHNPAFKKRGEDANAAASHF